MEISIFLTVSYEIRYHIGRKVLHEQCISLWQSHTRYTGCTTPPIVLHYSVFGMVEFWRCGLNYIKRTRFQNVLRKRGNFFSAPIPMASSLEMEEGNKNVRDNIMSQIPKTINSFLETAGSGAIRILGDTPNSVLTTDDKVGCISQFAVELESSVHTSRPSAQTRFLAVNIYPPAKTKHSYFVVDLNNIDYVYATAHNDMRPIPVYVLRLSKRKISIFRQEGLDATIAETLATMHNGHGNDPLPLVDDYTGTVQYKYPRSLSITWPVHEYRTWGYFGYVN